MKKLLLPLFSLCIYYIQAQSLSPVVIASSGNFKTTGGYSLSSTVGEPITTTVTAGSYILTQGFQQQKLKGVSVQSIEKGDMDIKVYPNPAVDEVTVLIFAPNASSTQVKLFDLLGRELTVPMSILNEGTQKQFSLNLNQLSASMYFITVYDTQSRITPSIKIQKIIS